MTSSHIDPTSNFIVKVIDIEKPEYHFVLLFFILIKKSNMNSLVFQNIYLRLARINFKIINFYFDNFGYKSKVVFFMH